MKTIFTKLKTSATLWSVIGGFVLSAANLIWANDTVASTIAGAVVAIIPASVYIYQKFKLRIAVADSDSNGSVSFEELVAAVKLALSDSSMDIKTTSDSIGAIANAITKEPDKE